MVPRWNRASPRYSRVRAGATPALLRTLWAVLATHKWVVSPELAHRSHSWPGCLRMTHPARRPSKATALGKGTVGSCVRSRAICGGYTGLRPTLSGSAWSAVPTDTSQRSVPSMAWPTRPVYGPGEAPSGKGTRGRTLLVVSLADGVRPPRGSAAPADIAAHCPPGWRRSPEKHRGQENLSNTVLL